MQQQNFFFNWCLCTATACRIDVLNFLVLALTRVVQKELNTQLSLNFKPVIRIYYEDASDEAQHLNEGRSQIPL